MAGHLWLKLDYTICDTLLNKENIPYQKKGESVIKIIIA
jgi:hypothetical protein